MYEPCSTHEDVLHVLGELYECGNPDLCEHCSLWCPDGFYCNYHWGDSGWCLPRRKDCDECWESYDGETCEPDKGKIKTICGSNSIQMTIDTCVLNKDYDYTGKD